MNEELKKLINILEEPDFLGYNTHGYNEDIESILKSSLGAPLETICCNLFHYTNDGDIREKDTEYREMQNNELRKLIVLLKNKNLEAAQDISFLHDSNGL